MPTNKELEKRMKELDRRIRLLEAQEKLMETGNQQIVERMSLPYISLRWDSGTRLWTAQLVQSANEEQLDFVVVVHDTAAQAFQILLHKLQQKVS